MQSVGGKRRYGLVFERYHGDVIQQAKELALKKNTVELTEAEQQQLSQLSIFGGGFCVAGYFLPDRTPRAFQILYGPSCDRAGSITELTPKPTWKFWGCPSVTDRVILGIDPVARYKILNSGKWPGSAAEFDEASRVMTFAPHTNLPLREAVDWVFAMIYVTVKAFKFSSYTPLCGGPIDIAVITSDRAFRWVRHKGFGAAIIRDDYHSADDY